MIVLGIETSCDETGVSVVEDASIRSNLLASQTDLHARFGGVVPELASRQHLVSLNILIAQAMDEAGLSFADLEAIAVTLGPGLIGALLVGVSAAKALASVLDLPLIGVNHLEGHVEAAFIERPDLTVPLIALIVSGGHTMIAEVAERGRYEILGQTIDDAAGEAFDKIARYIGLAFPGGPEIDRLARQGDPNAYRFPRAKMNDADYDFSYSGLKTAVIRWIRERQAAGEDIDAADLAASFQEAAVDVQVAKTLRAAEDRGVRTVVVAGGVAANSRLRERMGSEGERRGIDVVVPSMLLCTDNGAMIAAAGLRRLVAGERTPLDVSASPNLVLAWMDLPALSEIALADADGVEHRLGDLWASRPVVLVFLRHFGWLHCRYHAAQLRRSYSEITGRRAELVAIGTGDARYARSFIEDEDIPFPVLLDENGDAARAASVKKGGVLQLVGPQTAAGALKATAAGHRQHKTGKRGTQLGATFVIGPGDAVRYEHLDRDVSDHAPVEDVLAALPR